MDETNPVVLEQYLDDITRIKLSALEELSDEKLKSDHAFQIFLTQCANLISKIQSKIELEMIKTQSATGNVGSEKDRS
jgi:hypothetical protein